MALAAVTATAIWHFTRNGEVQIAGYRGEPITEIGSDPIIKLIPKEALQKQKDRLAELDRKLRENPEDFEAWMAVGNLKKFFNNYIGAIAAYEYAELLQPENALIHYNLANLYGLYLRDYPKAEQYYLNARKLASNYPYVHLGLAEFYRDFYQEKADQVDDVLLEGLKYIPNEPNLTLNLAYFYKNAGDKLNAIKYFKNLLNYPLVSEDHKAAIQKEVEALARE